MRLSNLFDYGLLAISGSDNFKLLQGQLTCDMTKVNSTHCLLGAHCNPQGRILSLAHLFVYDNIYYLFMLREMISIAIAALKKYALFYKVTLRDVSNDWRLIGSNAHGGSREYAGSCVKDNSLPISLAFDQTRYLHLQPKQTAIPFVEDTTFNWQSFNIRNGIPTIYPQTSGKLLPHELNLHLLESVISFEKGCYTGQEIIARMQYRGKSKKSTHQAFIVCEQKPFPGDPIYVKENSQLKECGIIIDICHESRSVPREGAGSIRYYLALIMIENSEAKNQHLFLSNSNQSGECRDPHFFKIETLSHD